MLFGLAPNRVRSGTVQRVWDHGGWKLRKTYDPIPDRAEREGLVERLTIATTLDVPHAILPLNVEERGSRVVETQPYRNGVTLGSSVRWFSHKKAARYAYQLFEALEALHAQGYAHVDVRSDNAYITGDELCLIDFELLTPVDETPQCRTRSARDIDVKDTADLLTLLHGNDAYPLFLAAWNREITTIADLRSAYESMSP